MLVSLIVLLIVGFLAGLIARALVPGNDSMSIPKTTLLGIVGSFVGGALGYVIFGADIGEGIVQTAGFIGSVIGAVIALIAYRTLVQDRPAFG